ncbi:MAG: sporulation protein YunB [Oscillospiraceae bacterium]
MISRKYIKRNNCRKINVTIRVFILSILIIAVLLEIFVGPILVKASEYQAKMILTNLLSDTINEILADTQIPYNGIVKIERGKDDKITSIETDINSINKIKSKITSNVSKAFTNLPSHSYALPLGTLLSNPFILGRGPDIKLTIIPMGYINSQIISEFSAAGINQTNYRVMLNITLNYTTIIPLHKSSSKIDTNFVIIDTIIVGEVPQYYTNINGNTSNQMGDARTIYPQKLE